MNRLEAQRRANLIGILPPPECHPPNMRLQATTWKLYGVAREAKTLQRRLTRWQFLRAGPLRALSLDLRQQQRLRSTSQAFVSFSRTPTSSTRGSAPSSGLTPPSAGPT